MTASLLRLLTRMFSHSLLIRRLDLFDFALLAILFPLLAFTPSA